MIHDTCITRRVIFVSGCDSLEPLTSSNSVIGSLIAEIATEMEDMMNANEDGIPFLSLSTEFIASAQPYIIIIKLICTHCSCINTNYIYNNHNVFVYVLTHTYVNAVCTHAYVNAMCYH